MEAILTLDAPAAVLDCRELPIDLGGNLPLPALLRRKSLAERLVYAQKLPLKRSRRDADIVRQIF
jgi:hypothetical protein